MAPERRGVAWRARVMLVFTAGLLLGCTNMTEDEASLSGLLDCGSGASASVEVGTGALAFEPILEGASIPLVYGPQGGYHVWISVRAAGLGPRVRVDYDVENADDALLLSPAGLRRIVTLEEQGGYDEVSGLLGFIETSNPAELANREVVLNASITDECHAPLRASAKALLVVP